VLRDEPHAVEIAAMLGDSVVGVKYCVDPRDGKLTRTTWALAAGGAVALVAAAFAFAISVETAAANEHARAAWHRPVAAFRAEQLSPAWDVLAFGGLAVGIVALGWALARGRDERRSSSYRIGTAPGVDQPCEGAPAPSFPLVAPCEHEHGFVFRLAAGIEAELLEPHAAKSVPLAGSGAHSILRGARIRARVGHTTFLVSSTPRPRREARARFRVPTLKYFAASLGAHVVMWALLGQLPVDEGGGQCELTADEAMAVRTTEIDHDAAVPPSEPSAGTGGGHEAGPATVGMKMAEGAAGSRARTAEPTHLQSKRRADVDRQYARAEAIEAARHAGIFGAGSPLETGVAAMAADQDFASGFESTDVMGPMYGPDGPLGSGGFGTGQTRLDHGGGGWATLGSGEYGVICTGGMRDCGGGSEGAGSIGHVLRRRHVSPIITCGFPVGDVIGDYDKATIRRYVRRELPALQYCYEHELLARPELAGEIVATFFVQPDGKVSASTAIGFDPTVASCVADVLASIEFPAPRGGGIEVKYPFVFEKAGE
jgi:hypothetical protein